MTTSRLANSFFGRIRGNAGFTLVEEIVTAMVSTVLVAAVMTVFSINTRENGESIGNAMVQMSSEVLSEEIGRNIREGNRLLVPGEPWNSGGIYTARPTKTLLIYSDAGLLLKGYTINGTFLEETDSAGQWQRFKTGNSDVVVDTSSVFSLMQSRKEAVVTIQTMYANHNHAYAAILKKEMYRCRN